MLGEALLDSGAITPGQLDQALEAQRTSGNLLGDVLRSMELVTDEALSRALAREAGMPFVSGGSIRVDPSAASLVPETFARRHLLAPLGMNGPSLEVMQANPFDVVALDDLSHLVRRPVVPFCATPDDVRRAIDGCYRARRPLASPTRHTRRLDELGMSKKQHVQLSGLLGADRGLVVVAGPDGSGKRTTIDAARTWLAAASRRAVSVGDIGDIDAAARAVDTARSGELTLATMRSRATIDAVTELCASGVDRHRLASVLIGIVAQRLIRVTCSACAAPATYPPEVLRRVGLGQDPEVVFRAGRGCHACSGTGYRARTGVFEVLVVNQVIRFAIDSGAHPDRVADIARQVLTSTLCDEALTAALLGRTTLDEVDALAREFA